ncbi:MAG: hypothetical protein EXR51_10100 [Dehalococcoidia bacterium]|nr:hypothetical protein [Dehalococcoidia bacterium]
MVISAKEEARISRAFSNAVKGVRNLMGQIVQQLLPVLLPRMDCLPLQQQPVPQPLDSGRQGFKFRAFGGWYRRFEVATG